MSEFRVFEDKKRLEAIRTRMTAHLFSVKNNSFLYLVKSTAFFYVIVESTEGHRTLSKHLQAYNNSTLKVRFFPSTFSALDSTILSS